MAKATPREVASKSEILQLLEAAESRLAEATAAEGVPPKVAPATLAELAALAHIDEADLADFTQAAVEGGSGWPRRRRSGGGSSSSVTHVPMLSSSDKQEHADDPEQCVHCHEKSYGWMIECRACQRKVHAKCALALVNSDSGGGSHIKLTQALIQGLRCTSCQRAA